MKNRFSAIDQEVLDRIITENRYRTIEELASIIEKTGGKDFQAKKETGK
ncbi:MAG: hypothetical protein JW881_13975 [Spirochaetales bacterium]|nr:hypothetical protein [Spirochaetales bacterium]